MQAYSALQLDYPTGFRGCTADSCIQRLCERILRLGRLLQLKNQADQNAKNEEVPRNLDETGFVVSKNLYGSLPDDEINLGIQINSANEGRFAGLYNVYLYLYKK